MHTLHPLPLLVVLPMVLSLICVILSSPRTILAFCAVGTTLVAALGGYTATLAFNWGTLFATHQWFMLDALSAYHLLIMVIVFWLSSLYCLSYFRSEIENGSFDVPTARRFGSLWFGSMAAMLLVLVSNNLGIMWVGIEATTLLTAFLICIHTSRASLEAMWKYLLMCSVGVALAFTGTLFLAASAGATNLHGTETLLWSSLMDNAVHLDSALVKAGFIFLVVGYGTKAGLAPMHNWLPDAHSQAPAPVSAIFSGFLLNAALYCILRCLPLVEISTGRIGWARDIIMCLGIFSILIAAIFIIAQHDIKRLLAYHSVEHLGIITLGIGFGGIGAFAGLFHIFNHSLCKTLAFFCAGSLGQRYKTHDMRQMTDVLRVSPVWGVGLLGSLLALIGVYPFALFLSEFLILKASLAAHRYWISFLFLGGMSIVFVGALQHVMHVAWEPSKQEPFVERLRILDTVLVLVPLLVLLTLGVWLPNPLSSVLGKAAAILEGAR